MAKAIREDSMMRYKETTTRMKGIARKDSFKTAVETNTGPSPNISTKSGGVASAKGVGAVRRMSSKKVLWEASGDSANDGDINEPGVFRGTYTYTLLY